MRKLEEKMVKAVECGKSFMSGSTSVNVSNDDGCMVIRVYLHGNNIFERVEDVNGLRCDCFNLCGWNTVTTRSRLNALGVGVSQKNWEPIYKGSVISTCKWYEVQ